jgi:predicted ATPase/class 3 adenylate cyclase
MDELFSLGQWIKRRRKASDLTQDELARRVGCSLETIRKIEADARRPSRQIAERLADQLALAPDERVAFLQAARAELAADQLAPPTRTVSHPTLVPAAALPRGTVTFLFSDIEGSTQLWARYPQAMGAAVARHEVILRDAITSAGGMIFKTVGDAVCAAFASALDAVQAALAGQRAMAAESWDVTGPLRVRMALHTGVVQERAGDYFGLPLSRLARILAAGHGGQVLLSHVTQELVHEHLPPHTELCDLGTHRLKDLNQPEQIFQLAAPDLPSDFPPLNTLDPRRTNLPVQLTPLIGREREVTEVCELLRRADVRLLTLSGPGGTGKTHLALQAAAELLDADSTTPPLPLRRETSESQSAGRMGGEGLFSDGIFFVNLAPIRDPALAISTIAQVFGVVELGSQPIEVRLASYLRTRHLLLLLDNFEQVIDAASRIAELLAAAPNVKALVTSREILHLYGEHEFAVPPLALPPQESRTTQRVPALRVNREPAGRDTFLGSQFSVPSSLEELTQYGAVRLFIARAQAAKTGFAVTNDNAPTVAEICYRLDGLPLSIELLAARVKLFPPKALLARLGQRLQVLTGGPRDLPARQQTLRNTIAWSYDLLDAVEQALFRRLGVFVGGCKLEAAEAVCDADGELSLDALSGLAALVDKSLLRQGEGPDGELRFVMLETVREYALERLETVGEIDTIRRAHATYYLALAEAAEPELRGPRQLGWLERLEAEHDNLRAALAWTLEGGDRPVGVRLVEALWWFWYLRGYWSEGRVWLADAQEYTLSPARVLLGAWYLATQPEDPAAAAQPWLEECLACARVAGDQRSEAHALAILAPMEVNRGDKVAARSLAEESVAVAKDLGDTWSRAFGLLCLGEAQDDFLATAAYAEESLRLFREVGDRWGQSNALWTLCEAAHRQGDYLRAVQYAEARLALAQALRDPWSYATALAQLGSLAKAQGDYAQAAKRYQEWLALCRELGHKQFESWGLWSLGSVAQSQGNVQQATEFYQESLARFRDEGDKGGVAACLEGMAWVAGTQGNAARVVRLFGAAATIRAAMDNPPYPEEQRDYERQLDAARAQLGEEVYAAAWAAGRELTLEQAIAEALGGNVGEAESQQTGHSFNTT